MNSSKTIKTAKFGMFSRMLLALFALIVAMLAVLGYSLLQNTETQFKNFRLKHAQSTAHTLAEGSLDALITEDYELLQRFVKSSLPTHHGAYAYLTRPNGQIISSTDLSLTAIKIILPEISGEYEIRSLSYNKRPVIEVVNKAIVGEKHLANAHIAYYIDQGNFNYLNQAKDIIITLIIMLTIILIGTYLIVSRLKNPILALINTVVNTSFNSPFYLPQKMYRRKDEVGVLARTFDDVYNRLFTANAKIQEAKNQLEINVEKRTQQLADINEELNLEKTRIEHKVKERTRELNEINKELKVTRDAALDASKIKSEFLSTISHELRTPLHAISGYENILSTTNLSDTQAKYCKHINTGAQNLLEIINEILDFSAFESGELKIESNTFSITEIIKDICQMFLQSAEKKGLKLSYHIDKNVPSSIYSDAKRLRQIIVNLVSNAIKFTELGKISVTVKLAKNENMKTQHHLQELLIDVSDTGIGIEKTQFERIFSPFYQVDGSVTRSYGGTGLGLAMSTKILELMGGKISVHSHSGQGSTFTISMPLFSEESSQLDEKISPLSIIDIDEKVTSDINVINTESDKKIIIVEDNEINAELLTIMLNEIGYNAEIAENGRAFLDKMSKNNYDLILMDCQMPILNGYDATKQYRESEDINTHIPIIAVTANAMTGDKEKCLASGMDDYIQKPVRPKVLKKTIHQWLNTPQKKVSS